MGKVNPEKKKVTKTFGIKKGWRKNLKQYRKNVPAQPRPLPKAEEIIEQQGSIERNESESDRPQNQNLSPKLQPQSSQSAKVEQIPIVKEVADNGVDSVKALQGRRIVDVNHTLQEIYRAADPPELKLEHAEIHIQDSIDDCGDPITIKTEIDSHDLDNATDSFYGNANKSFASTANDNLDISESPICSTSLQGSSRSSIKVIPQARESNWLGPGTNAAEVIPAPVGTRDATTALETAAKSAASAAASPLRKQKELSVPTTDLCVLCAKDISKNRKTHSIVKYSDIILLLTGINVLDYKIFPNACPTCYRSVCATKNFQKQVCKASELIKAKLAFYEENQFEFATVTTDTNEEQSQVTDQSAECSYIEPPVVDMQEMHVQGSTVITDSTLDISAVASIDGTSKDDQSVPVIFKAVFPFSKCNTCGRLYKDLINHNCQGAEVAPPQPESSTLQDVPLPEEKKAYNTRPRKVKVNALLKRQKLKTLCQVCGKMYYKSSYRVHIRSHIGATRECKICGKQIRLYSFRFHLLRHQKKKTDKRVICSVCGKMYSQMSSLKKHEVVHGEKRHKCGICDQSFHYRKYLQRHLRSHSGEKPFSCNYCGKKFSIVWNLHQHERLHTDKRPYQCRVCSASFRHNVTLKHHLSSLHSAQEIAASSQNSGVKPKPSESASDAGKKPENSNGDKGVCDNAPTEKGDTSGKCSLEPESQ